MRGLLHSVLSFQLRPSYASAFLRGWLAYAIRFASVADLLTQRAGRGALPAQVLMLFRLVTGYTYAPAAEAREGRARPYDAVHVP